MEPTSHLFKEKSSKALTDKHLQKALSAGRGGFVTRRAEAAAALPEFERLRDQARDIKNHVLGHLDIYLEEYEKKLLAAGGQVHWCETPQEARDAIIGICRDLGAKTVTKGKSMITEEIGINDAILEAGMDPVETDLGEYIVQMRGETPSHVIAPAVHVTKEQIEADFRERHTHLPEGRNLDEAADLVDEARQVLRQKYLEADVGITGANFLVAETGTSIIVTNEGNGDLTQTLPKAHIVMATIDKIVPTLEDVSTILRVLARSATGQEFSSYTTFSTGPRRAGDPDGPNHYHVIILDNGRSRLLGSEFQDVLRCIRCGACMNHCPVYQAVGGHAYGWVYPGPIGSVLTPGLVGVDKAGSLPNASTFCGRCEEVCPMRIPLPKMMRHWREKEFEQGLTPTTARRGLAIWAWLANRPAIYRMITGIAAGTLRIAGGGKRRLKSWPLAGGWTTHRDLPAPQGRTFMAQWKSGRRSLP